MKQYRLHSILVLITAIFWIVLEWMRPVQFNWQPTLINTDKNPYGAWIFYHETKSMLPGGQIRVSRLPVFDQLNDSGSQRINYVLIAPEITLADFELARLKDFVRKGNHVLIAAATIAKQIQDSLGVSCNNSIKLFSGSDTVYRFCNPALEQDVFAVPSFTRNYITVTDSSLDVSGIIGDLEGRMVMVKINMGEGSLLLTTLPLMFSNRMILQKGMRDVPFIAFSSLPSGLPVVWDEYLKQGRQENTSPIRVILSEQSLRWAYFVSLLGILLILLIETRRKRSMVPVVEPLTNTSVDFVKVIGLLHFEQKNYSDIAKKRITTLLERIRMQYNLNLHNTESLSAEVLSGKTGFSLTDSEELIKNIELVQHAKSISRQELIRLNRIIESFVVNTNLKI